MEPLQGYTFEGYRNADGSVGTRNILAIATSVQCVAGVTGTRCAASNRNCCRIIPMSMTWD
ncbi:MAG: UxaA family hydrolase [Thiolinea sp.]